MILVIIYVPHSITYLINYSVERGATLRFFCAMLTNAYYVFIQNKGIRLVIITLLSGIVIYGLLF
jgi:hypothetical protein